MFVQVIEGRTSDPEGIKRQGERWQAELRPGAVGFLGVTAGAAPDGRTFTCVRFDSEEAARANAARPEQSAWFEELQKYYDGEPSFLESSDTADLLGGGSNDAGFVQVMKMNGMDRAAAKRFDDMFVKVAADWRPDLLGVFRVWTGPDSLIDINYFTSEADARAAEQKPPPAELQEMMGEYAEMMQNTEYIDLPDPQIH